MGQKRQNEHKIVYKKQSFQIFSRHNRFKSFNLLMLFSFLLIKIFANSHSLKNYLPCKILEIVLAQIYRFLQEPKRQFNHLR